MSLSDVRYFYDHLTDLELNEVEREAWIHSREEKFDSEALFEVLSNLKNDQGLLLSQRSKQFLTLKTSEEKLEFVEKYKSQPLTRKTNIVQMIKMNKNLPDEKGISVLIVATEEKEILIRVSKIRFLQNIWIKLDLSKKKLYSKMQFKPCFSNFGRFCLYSFEESKFALCRSFYRVLRVI